MPLSLLSRLSPGLKEQFSAHGHPSCLSFIEQLLCARPWESNLETQVLVGRDTQDGEKVKSRAVCPSWRTWSWKWEKGRGGAVTLLLRGTCREATLGAGGRVRGQPPVPVAERLWGQGDRAGPLGRRGKRAGAWEAGLLTLRTPELVPHIRTR